MYLGQLFQRRATLNNVGRHNEWVHLKSELEIIISVIALQRTYQYKRDDGGCWHSGKAHGRPHREGQAHEPQHHTPACVSRVAKRHRCGQQPLTATRGNTQSRYHVFQQELQRT